MYSPSPTRRGVWGEGGTRLVPLAGESSTSAPHPRPLSQRERKESWQTPNRRTTRNGPGPQTAPCRSYATSAASSRVCSSRVRIAPWMAPTSRSSKNGSPHWPQTQAGTASSARWYPCRATGKGAVERLIAPLQCRHFMLSSSCAGRRADGREHAAVGAGCAFPNSSARRGSRKCTASASSAVRTPVSATSRASAMARSSRFRNFTASTFIPAPIFGYGRSWSRDSSSQRFQEPLGMGRRVGDLVGVQVCEKRE